MARNGSRILEQPVTPGDELVEQLDAALWGHLADDQVHEPLRRRRRDREARRRRRDQLAGAR